MTLMLRINIKYLIIFQLILCPKLLLSQSQIFNTYSENILGTKLKINMIPIDGNQFKMGSSSKEKGRKNDEGPTINVLIDDFWISELEITWDLFELFLNREIDKFKPDSRKIKLDIDAISGATAPYVNYNKKGYPVINVTQYAASQFCKWLTAKTGNYYRLPTEAEWEYACRAGGSGAFSFGNNARKMDDYGWFKKNSQGKIQRGKLKKPNAFGLYDMHGNVAEWVLDSYDAKTYIVWGNGIENPVRKKKGIYPRVVRGGSFKDDINDLRSAARNHSTPSWKQRDPQIPKSLWWHTDATHVGFRIVRPRDEPKMDELNKMWVPPKKEY